MTIIAAQTGQQIRVPKLAAVEAEASFARYLSSTLSQWEAATSNLERDFELEYVDLEPRPDVESRVSVWRERLPQFVTVFELDGETAIEALEREAWGHPPTKRIAPEKGKDKGGRGARDAAIWLAIARDHADRGEESHFISANIKDFALEGELHPELMHGIADTQELHYYPSIEDFLSILGQAAKGPLLTLEQLEEQVSPILKSVLALTLDIPIAIFGRERATEFAWSVDVKDASPLEVTAVKQYEREGEALAIVDSRWNLTADCFRQHLGDQRSMLWEGFDDVSLTGSVQFYLPVHEPKEGDGLRLPQVISARLQTEGWAYFGS